MMFNSLGVCFINIVLNYLLIPVYGIVGAAIASGASIIIYVLVILMEVYVLLKIHPYNRNFIKITLFGLFVYGLFITLEYTVLDLSGLQRILISVPLFLSVFAWLIYRWGTDENDIFIFDTFKKYLSRRIT